MCLFDKLKHFCFFMVIVDIPVEMHKDFIFCGCTRGGDGDLANQTPLVVAFGQVFGLPKVVFGLNLVRLLLLPPPDLGS